MSRSLRRATALLVVLMGVVLVFGGRLISLYVDYLWFQSTGYSTVFITPIVWRVLLFFAGLALFLLLFLPNVVAARALCRRLLRHAPPRVAEPPERGGAFGSIFGGGRMGQGGGDIPRPFAELMESMGGPDAGRWLLERIGGELAVIAGLILSVIMGLAAAAEWDDVLRFLHRMPFGVADPVFGQDVGFYMFTLPLVEAFQSWLFWAVLLAGAASGALYAVSLYAVDPSYEHAGFHLNNRARAMRTHLLVLGAVLALLVAAGVWIGTYDLLIARHERIVGANFTDLHARLPAARIQAATAVLVALLCLVTVFRRSYVPLVMGVVLFFAVLVVGRGALPALVQRLQVDPAELAQETPYLAQNIRFTRMAYGLQSIAEQTFPAEEAVTPQDVDANRQTINNVRLWDHRPLKDTYNQVQSIRPYYAFDDIDVDRYTVDGQYRQVMLSARELLPGRLGAQAQTWVNRRLQYTHGYGAAMSPVNEVSREGLPSFFLQDLPPSGKLPVTRPEVYYGEQTPSYVIVNTRTQEFDYPKGEQSAFSTYEGHGGVQIGPLWQRAALAWYFGDFNILVSTYLQPDSKVLFRRDIKDRVTRLAPFLKLDQDPYLVVVDGKLMWMLDGYTTADRFPYAQRTLTLPGTVAPLSAATAAATTTTGAPDQPVIFRRDALNYVRNSAKIVVDAYDGSVAVYLADPTDPVVQVYAGIFPDVFRPLSDMPASLRAHLRYPEDLFTAQSQILRVYHVQDPQVFYNGEDVWGTAMESLGDRRVAVEPYYVIMRLPGQTDEEFLLMLPFTPASRDNMVSWLAARSDGAEYGKLLLYKFPRDRLVYGPAQIDARIDQDPTISGQLTLWNQQGSRVIRGNLLVIPIANSTLYVKPLYLQSENSRLPELKRVVVATGNRLAMEASLDEVLDRLFGSGAAVTQPPGTTGATGAASAAATATARGTPVPAASPTARVATPGAQATPPPAGALESPAEAARAARETYDRAIDALRSGDFARFGDELKNLDDRLRDVERSTGGGAGP